jgi:hypothetical protein
MRTSGKSSGSTHDDEKIEKLSQIIQLISTRNKDLRFLFQKQKMALQKFQREAGEDWRNSRFVSSLLWDVLIINSVSRGGFLCF